jgi:hypothetical protein
VSVFSFEAVPEVGWAGRGVDRPIAIFATSRAAIAVRTGIGFAAAIVTLVLPWFGRALSPNFSAWNLTFSFGAVPLVGHLSYGAVIFLLTACGLVSFARAGWRRTVVTCAVGWSYLVLALIFILTTRLAGGATLFALQSDASQASIINSQFLTKNSTPPPTQFLGMTFDSKTMVLLYALRLGWYFLLVAGIFLAGRISRPKTRPQRIAWWASGAAVVVTVGGLVFGLAAQSDLDGAVQAVAAGHPVAAEQLAASALRWNSQAAYDTGFVRALGAAQADQGRVTGLAEYSQAVRPMGKDITLLEQAQLFVQALHTLPAGSPANTVVEADVVSFLTNATVSAKNPALLDLAGGRLDSPAVTFTVGHYDYEAGDNGLAIANLERTVQDTTNSEVRSLALTYIALAWERRGNVARFRGNIVAAVRADKMNQNVYARELAAGLYVPGTP